MSEVRLHMWEKSYRDNRLGVSCKANNYTNAYDEKKRESYSARGKTKVGHEGRNIPAVKILHDPLPRCNGGFAHGARFKRDEFRVMMEQGVVTENTRIWVDGDTWLVVSSNGGKAQRKTRVEV